MTNHKSLLARLDSTSEWDTSITGLVDLCREAAAAIRGLQEGSAQSSEKDKFHEREPLNIIMRYKAERTTEVEAAAEIRAYVAECMRRAVTQIPSPSAICPLIGCRSHVPHAHGVVE